MTQNDKSMAERVAEQTSRRRALSLLDRPDLEAAVLYWEPRCLASMREAETLRAELALYRKMAKSRSVWKRLRWALKGGTPK